MKLLLIVLLLVSSCTTTRYRGGENFRFDAPKKDEQFVRKEKIKIEENYFVFGAVSTKEIQDIGDYVRLGENETLCNVEIKNEVDAGDFWSMVGVSIISAGLGSPLIWTTRTTTITGDVVTPKGEPVK